MEDHGDGVRRDLLGPVDSGEPVEETDPFVAVASVAPDGVLIAGSDGRVAWANPAAATMFGRAREDLVGRAVTDLLPEAFSLGGTEDEAGSHGDRATTFLAEGLRSSGETFEVSVTSGVHRATAGGPSGRHLVVRDLTADLALERRLTDAVARSRARFDQSTLPQALLDLQGRFVEVNDAGCALLGWPRDELVGRDSIELVHPTHPGQVRRLLARLREGSLRTASYETTGRTADGRLVPLLVDITAVRDVDGRAFEFAAFARDLREAKEAERRIASQEAFFRSLNREASDVTVVVDVDGRLLYVSPSVTQVLGYEPDQILDVLAPELVHAEDLREQRARRRRLRDVRGSRERFRIRIQDAAATWRWFETTATNCVDDPDIGGIVLNLREVTPEVEAEQALRDSEARYRAIAETAQEGILAVSTTGEVLFANDRLVEILGAPMEQVHTWGRRGIFASDEAADAAVRLASTGASEGPERFDFRYRRPDGGVRVLQVSASALPGADGTVLGSLAMVSDVTEQRAAEEALRHQALHDPLTGLPNRLLFVERLSRAAARRTRSGQGAVAVLFLDLDHFKAVNDTYGHEVGDRLLVEVASRLEQAVRSTDTVARLGGDEFAVICEGDEATASLVATRIQATFTEPVVVAGESFRVGMSIGAALSPPHPAADLLQHADTAMYHAKAVARGGLVTFDARLADEVVIRRGRANSTGQAPGCGRAGGL